MPVTDGAIVALTAILEGCWDLPRAELSKRQREAMRKLIELTEAKVE